MRFTMQWNRPLFYIVVIILLQTGCGQSQPQIAGGKTTDDWIDALEDKSVEVRVEAIRKLGNIGRKDPHALPAVIAAISDDSPRARSEVIYAIVRNWPASRNALPQLEELQENDQDATIRKLAAEAHHNLSLK